VFFDGAVEGFALRVGKRKKTFVLVVQWRRDGERGTTRHKLGTFPETSAAEARRRAQAILGRDRPDLLPSMGPTLAKAWQSFRAALEARPASPGTISNYAMAFRQLVHLHGVSLRALSDDPSLIADEHAKLTKAGTPVGANAMARFIRAVYRHARKATRGLPDDLPTSGVVWNKEKPKTRALSSEDLTLWEKERRAIANPIQRELALFLLLSGLRRRDACSARWHDLSVRRRVLHRPLPKGKEEDKPSFDLPLSKPMLRCLCRLRVEGRRLHPQQAREWIFPSDASRSGHIEKIKKVRLSHHGHDLRRSFAGLALEAGTPQEVISRLMNHSLPGITQRYQVSAALATFLRECQEKISRHIVARLKVL
jgi:integrase